MKTVELGESEVVVGVVAKLARGCQSAYSDFQFLIANKLDLIERNTFLLPLQPLNPCIWCCNIHNKRRWERGEPEKYTWISWCPKCQRWLGTTWSGFRRDQKVILITMIFKPHSQQILKPVVCMLRARVWGKGQGKHRLITNFWSMICSLDLKRRRTLLP